MAFRQRHDGDAERSRPVVVGRVDGRTRITKDAGQPIDDGLQCALPTRPAQDHISRDAEQPQSRLAAFRDRVELPPSDQVGLGDHVCSVLGAIGAPKRVGEQIATRPVEELPEAGFGSLARTPHEPPPARNSSYFAPSAAFESPPQSSRWSASCRLQPGSLVQHLSPYPLSRRCSTRPRSPASTASR